MKRLKPDQPLTDRLSITQSDLADYLGISRSLLAMHQNHLRSLPTQALLKLSRLAQLHAEVTMAKSKRQKKQHLSPGMLQHNDKMKKNMLAHAETCNYKKKLLQRRLNKIILFHQQAEIWTQLIERLMEDISQNKEHKGDRLWLEVQKVETLQKLQRNGIAFQAKIRAQIQVMEFEENTYKKMADEIF